MKTVRWTMRTRVGALAALVACSGEDRASAGEVRLPRQPGPVGSSTITGRVRLVGTAPPNPAIDMREEPQCRGVYHSQPHQLTVVVNRRRLANVFVYVRQGLPPDAIYPPPVTPVTLDQRGCQYQPRVFGIMVGQPLEIRNADPVLHTISAKRTANRPFNIRQPRAGMTADHIFHAAKVMIPLECNVHGWMRAYAGVLPHPFFATTGRDGRFTIDHLPSGTYTIEAWHEKYGRRTATVTVADSATSRLVFTYAAADAVGTT